MPRRLNPRADAGADREPSNEEKISAVLRDAGDFALSVDDIASRSGVKAVSVYLSHMVRRDPPLAVRVGRGMYRAPRPRDAVDVIEASACVPALLELEEQAAEDIRAAERQRIAAALAPALADAVPKEAQDYIAGFRDGANFVAERVLGLTIEANKAPT